MLLLSIHLVQKTNSNCDQLTSVTGACHSVCLCMWLCVQNVYFCRHKVDWIVCLHHDGTACRRNYLNLVWRRAHSAGWPICPFLGQIEKFVLFSSRLVWKIQLCPFVLFLSFFFGRAQIHQFWGDFSLKSSIFVIFYMFQQKHFFEKFILAKCTSKLHIFLLGNLVQFSMFWWSWLFQVDLRKFWKCTKGGPQDFSIFQDCPFLSFFIFYFVLWHAKICGHPDTVWKFLHLHCNLKRVYAIVPFN